MSTDTAVPPLELSDVTIGVLTALEDEYAACRRVFDPDERGRQETRLATSGSFTCWICSIQAKHGGAHVVAISLLTGMGNNAAAIGANILLQHCPKVRSLIMCGIAGAVPNCDDPENHVRLGDIVVTDVSGIIQYDFGKQRDPRAVAASSINVGAPVADPLAGFEYRGHSHSPGPDLLAAVQRVHADVALLAKRKKRRWEELIENFLRGVGNPAEWKRPRTSFDVLNDSPNGTGNATQHPNETNRGGRPRVFRGAIGSANIVQADPTRRNALRERHKKIRAVEMEGSGLADASWIANVGYLVVRGTCDYCNSTKNDCWHRYAALIAAAFTRTVIEYLHPTGRRDTTAAVESLRSQAIPSQNRGVLHGDTGQVASTTNIDDTATKYPLGAEPFLPIENATPLNAAKAETAPAETANVDNGAVPSPELTQQIATELQVRSVVDIETDLVRVYTKKIDTLLKEFRISETAPLAAELEKQLRLRPRTGQDVRAGWIALAQIESQFQIQNRQAGRPIDINRLKMLRQEADNVTD